MAEDRQLRQPRPRDETLRAARADEGDPTFVRYLDSAKASLAPSRIRSPLFHFAVRREPRGPSAVAADDEGAIVEDRRAADQLRRQPAQHRRNAPCTAFMNDHSGGAERDDAFAAPGDGCNMQRRDGTSIGTTLEAPGRMLAARFTLGRRARSPCKGETSPMPTRSPNLPTAAVAMSGWTTRRNGSVAVSGSGGADASAAALGSRRGGGATDTIRRAGRIGGSSAVTIRRAAGSGRAAPSAATISFMLGCRPARSVHNARMMMAPAAGETVGTRSWMAESGRAEADPSDAGSRRTTACTP